MKNPNVKHSNDGGADVRFIRSEDDVLVLEVLVGGKVKLDAETYIENVKPGTYTFDKKTKELKAV